MKKTLYRKFFFNKIFDRIHYLFFVSSVSLKKIGLIQKHIANKTVSIKKIISILIILFSFSSTVFSQLKYPCGVYLIGLNGTSTDGGVWDYVFNSPDLTLAVWMKLTDSTSIGKRMDIFNRYDFNVQGENTNFSLGLNENGEVVFRSLVIKAGDERQVFDSVVFSLKPKISVWYHIAFTFNSNTHVGTAYVNGEQTNSKALAGPLSYINVGSAYSHYMAFGLRDGGQYAGYSNFYKGYLDEAAYCSKELTADNIKSLAKGIMPGDPFLKENNVILYHKFDDYPSQPNYGIAGGSLPTGGQYYYCPATLTTNILDPNPSMILNDGSLDSDQSKIDYNALVNGAATDGVSKLLLTADATVPITFSLPNPKDGILYSLDDQHTLVTKVSINPKNGKVVCVYEVPDSYGESNLVGGRYITVQAYYSSDSSHKTDFNIQLITPPVVLIHGMWSNPEVWKTGGFEDYLKNKGIRDIYLADYSESNAQTFDPKSNESQSARDAIFSQISYALSDARSKNIVVSQVDVVGHSLGGLQARSFSQDHRFLSKSNYYKGYFHKLITIGTPHMGSSEGPLLYYGDDVIAKFACENPLSCIGYASVSKLVGILSKMKIGSCHKDFNPLFKITGSVLSPLSKALSDEINRLAGTKIDLQLEGSGGLYNLNATSGFKVHAITSRWDSRGIGSENGWLKYIGIISLNFVTNHLLGDTASDLIVPKYSQLGGITNKDYYDSYENTSHSNLIFSPMSQTNSRLIQEKTADLLLSDDVTKFGATFPAPRTIPSPFDLNYSGRYSSQYQNKSIQKRTSNNYELKIQKPDRNQVFLNDGTDSITVKISFTDSSKLRNLLLLMEGIGFIDIPNSAPFEIKIPIPETISTRRARLLALANDADGNIYADSTSLVIHIIDTLTAIDANPSIVKLDSLSRTGKISVTATFKNADKTITRNISSIASGVQYFPNHGNAVISIDNEGTIRGVQPGIDTVVVKYDSMSTMFQVFVDSSLFSAAKFANAITFSVEDKDVSAPPFILHGYDSAGSEIIYKLVSGPVILNEGVVTIQGPGTVVITASSYGNAYFDSAKTVTRTFKISSTLPLTLVSFSGKKINNTIQLQWQTSSEQNTSYFSIERSADGIKFESIGKVNAAANSSDRKDYLFTDYAPLTGNNFYRLKTIDKDEKYSFSKTISVENNGGNTFKIYPNPANKTLFIDLPSTNENTSIGIYDINGRKVKELQTSNTPNISIDINNLSKGVYNVILKSSSKTVQRRFVKE